MYDMPPSYELALEDAYKHADEYFQQDISECKRLLSTGQIDDATYQDMRAHIYADKKRALAEYESTLAAEYGPFFSSAD